MPTSDDSNESVKFNIHEYGYNVISGMLNTYYGEKIPDDPTEAAIFWKKKTDLREQEVIKYRSQVELLRGIIVSMSSSGRGCNCD